jgi:hypothetical protein
MRLVEYGNRAIERGPTLPPAKGRNHQAGIAEHCLRLNQSLPFHSADQPVGVDVDVIERERCRIAESNAVLIFRLVVLKPFAPFSTMNQLGPAGVFARTV